MRYQGRNYVVLIYKRVYTAQELSKSAVDSSMCLPTVASYRIHYNLYWSIEIGSSINLPLIVLRRPLLVSEAQVDACLPD